MTTYTFTHDEIGKLLEAAGNKDTKEVQRILEANQQPAIGWAYTTHERDPSGLNRTASEYLDAVRTIRASITVVAEAPATKEDMSIDIHIDANGSTEIELREDKT